MDYRFLWAGDEEVIAMSELEAEDGIAVALRTTGYEAGSDEIVELAICDLAGNELFSKAVKPQNVEDWEQSDASGKIAPSDVADAPELYQFEDEISSLFERARIAVFLHRSFAESMMEASWITLPDYEGIDLSEKFRATHGTDAYPDEPAPAVALDGMAAYYGIELDQASLAGQARAMASCYRALVAEHGREREAKGAAYWEAYNRKLAEQRASDERVLEAQRIQDLKAARLNAILWLCAVVINCNIAVQLYIHGYDSGIVVAWSIAAVFFIWRWIVSLLKVRVG